MVCALCGGGFKVISWAHLKYAHGWRGRTVVRRYLRRFGVVVAACDETRDKIRRKVRADWLRKCQRRTRAGVLKAMRTRAAQGRRLGRRAVPHWLSDAGIRHFGSWKAAVDAAVGDYRAHCHVKYRTRAEVLADIRAFAAQGVDLTPSVVARERPGLYDAGTRMFPWSWRKALQAADIDPERYPNPQRRWDDAKARAWVQRAARRGPVHARQVPVSLYQYVRYTLGQSWPAWVGEVAGPQAMADRRPVWTQARVLRAVRRLLRDGVRGARLAVARDRLVASQARRVFGSWKRAVEAARE